MMPFLITRGDSTLNVSNEYHIFHSCLTFLNHCLVDTTLVDELLFSSAWFLVSLCQSKPL